MTPSAPSTSLIDRLFGLHGSVALVTGGMGRLGSQYVRALAAAGASVAVFDLPGRENPHVRDLVDRGRPVAAFTVDATDRRAVDAAMDAAHASFGPVNVLVNNAGLGSSPADAALET